MAGRAAWTAGAVAVSVTPPPPLTPAAAAVATTMRFGVNMDKYSRMSGGVPPANDKYAGMGTTNTALDKYARMAGFSMGGNSAGTRLASTPSYTEYIARLVALRQFSRGMGVSVVTGVKAKGGARADAYVAECVRIQYKRQVNPSGVVRWCGGPRWLVR